MEGRGVRVRIHVATGDSLGRGQGNLLLNESRGPNCTSPGLCPGIGALTIYIVCHWLRQWNHRLGLLHTTLAEPMVHRNLYRAETPDFCSPPLTGLFLLWCKTTTATPGQFRYWLEPAKRR